MGIVQTYSCKQVRARVQPGSPTHNDAYLLDSSGISGADWLGHENKIVVWDDLIGWLILGLPRKGDQVYDELQSQWLFYDGTDWRKSSQFSVNGSTDQVLTSSFVELTNWGSPDTKDNALTYGCFDWSGGQLELVRNAKRILHRAVVRVDQTAIGNQNDFTVQLEKQAGGSGAWVGLGPETGGSTFSTTNMQRGTATLIFEDSAPTSGDKYRLAAKHVNGSGGLSAMGAGMHWHAMEIN